MPFDLKKSLPKTGTRFALPALFGSSDAYALSVAALELKASKQMLAVVVANASDAQRLLDEIPWFGGDKLRDNAWALLELIQKLKPATAKGTYVKSIAVSTTMGPSVRIDVNQVQAKFAEA